MASMASDAKSGPSSDGPQLCIINEFLCFIQNKVNTMNIEEIIMLCLKSFKDEEIARAKKILQDICNETKVPTEAERLRRRTGTNKGRRNIEDIIGMFHDLGTPVFAAPVFAAQQLHKLPPISFDSLDVTHFLHRMEKMETELTHPRSTNTA